MFLLRMEHSIRVTFGNQSIEALILAEKPQPDVSLIKLLKGRHDNETHFENVAINAIVRQYFTFT